MEITIIDNLDNNNQQRYGSQYLSISEKVENLLKVDANKEVSVIFVDDEMIHQINKEYRNIDKATDVISFALNDASDDYQCCEEVLNELGDIFINVDAIVRQASEYGHSEQREANFLFTHGLLHLLGYDHMTSSDEAIMFGLQKEILGER
ncbi:MAG: rRNA maturation RNase YbeY [Erysipelotrichaceae bacterium]